MRQPFFISAAMLLAATCVFADAGKSDKDTLEVHGRVLGPDGKPKAGASLSLKAPKEGAKPTPLTTSDAEGRFKITVIKSSIEGAEWIETPWTRATILASAAGCGPDWIELEQLPANGEWTARLVDDDAPVEGAVVDLGGKPLAGVTIDLHAVYSSQEGSLDRFLAGIKDNPFGMRERGLLPHSLWGAPAGVPITRKTDDQGRFRITGIGRERMVQLGVTGPGIESLSIYVLTRRDANLKALKNISSSARTMLEAGANLPVIYPSRFHHLAAPSWPIVGTVRDKATRKPVGGLGVTIYARGRESFVHVKADALGRYRIEGLPAAGPIRALAISTNGEPYLKATRELTLDATDAKPVTVDLEVAKGILIRGRMSDASTGKPVRGSVTYLAYLDNPFLKDVPEIGGDGPGVSTNADGSYSLVALPGTGILAARASSDRFCASRPEQWGRPPGDRGTYDTAQMGLVRTSFFHKVVAIDPAKDAGAVVADIALDPGISVSGTLVDAGGNRVEGATASGLTALGFSEPLKDATFTVTGLESDRPRHVWFVHPKRNLGRMVTLPGNDPAPMTIGLEPCGAFIGRAVGSDGMPRPNTQVFVAVVFQDDGMGHSQTRTDSDGRFRITGLLTGLNYALTVEGATDRINGLVVRPGETRDLGDIGPDTKTVK